VLELRPAIDWDKGTALGWLLEALGLAASGSFPIYIGDDVTDEDAFRAVGKNGLAVVVRGRQGKTRASFALEDPAAVREFLARLDQELGPT
jgi:trehalose-phosphatase